MQANLVARMGQNLSNNHPVETVHDVELDPNDVGPLTRLLAFSYNSGKQAFLDQVLIPGKNHEGLCKFADNLELVIQLRVMLQRAIERKLMDESMSDEEIQIQLVCELPKNFRDIKHVKFYTTYIGTVLTILENRFNLSNYSREQRIALLSLYRQYKSRNFISA